MLQRYSMGMARTLVWPQELRVDISIGELRVVSHFSDAFSDLHTNQSLRQAKTRAYYAFQLNELMEASPKHCRFYSTPISSNLQAFFLSLVPLRLVCEIALVSRFDFVLFALLALS